MGGRGSKSGLTARPRVTPAPPQAFQVQQQPPQMQPTAQQAQQANNAAFSDTDNSPFHDLYNGAQYFQQQNLTADQQSAIVQYLRDDQETINGVRTQYSMAQNMNWLMQQNADKGLPIDNGMNANQRFTLKHMMGAMHNLGYNTNLTRYDHGEFVNKILTQAGFRNADFTQMSTAQLQQALTGKTYGEERLVSTSYNNFKNAPQAQNTFMHRAVRIEYQAKASTQAMMPGNGPGGRFGEIVLAPSGGKQNYRIIGVRHDSSVGVRRKGTSWYSSQPQLVLTVEVG